MEDQELGTFLDELSNLPADPEQVVDPVITDPVEPEVVDPAQVDPASTTVEVPQVSVQDLNVNSDPSTTQADDKDAIIEELRRTILELSAGTATAGSTAAAGTGTQVTLFPTQPQPDATVQAGTPGTAGTGGEPQASGAEGPSALSVLQDLAKPQMYLSEEELDRVIDKPELINQAIHKSVVQTLGTVSTVIPQMVEQVVAQRMAINNAVSEFYEKNQDLRPYGDFVAATMRINETQMRDKTYEEIFNKTAEDCRKRLGLKPAGQVPSAPNSTQRPALAGTRKGTSTRPATNGNEWFDPAAADMI